MIERVKQTFLFKATGSLECIRTTEERGAGKGCAQLVMTIQGPEMNAVLLNCDGKSSTVLPTLEKKRPTHSYSREATAGMHILWFREYFVNVKKSQASFFT